MGRVLMPLHGCVCSSQSRAVQEDCETVVLSFGEDSVTLLFREDFVVSPFRYQSGTGVVQGGPMHAS